MTPDYKNASLLYNTNEKITENYIAKSNGFIIGSGYGTGQSTSYIYATINGVRSGNQGTADEMVGIAMPIKKAIISIWIFACHNKIMAYISFPRFKEVC